MTPRFDLKPHDDPAYEALPCTREAIDAYLDARAAALGQPMAPRQPRYPDEWYADKNNRIANQPTGHVRFENVGRGTVAVWVAAEEAA